MKRLLALVPGGVGDQLLFFPTLTTLKRSFPNALIDVVVEPRSACAYRVCGTVNEVLQFDFKAQNSLADIGNLLGTIRDRNYDGVISLGTRFWARFLLWLTGIPVRVGYAGQGNWLLTNVVPLNPEQYASHMYHDLLKGLGITADCPPIILNLPKSDLEWAKQTQQQMNLTGGYILLHGGSSSLAVSKGIHKIYPPEKWVEVLQTIQPKVGGLPIVLVQGPEDREFVEAIAQAMPHLPIVSPPDIGKLSALIAGANLLLCTDSAPMHIGVAVGTALVAVFGPTDPAKLLPSEPRIRFVKGETIDAIPPSAIVDKILS
jgi:ADP-heptose:LPS heptosyltransferase